MKKKNSDIINEVKKSVGTNNIKEKISDTSDNKEIIKSIVNNWLEKNGDRITKEILNKEIKDLFK